jgi:hypothetical protein
MADEIVPLSKRQRPIPEAALRDDGSVEILRVWIAEQGLHCSLKIGMYHESTQIPEPKAWGVILADVARHVSNALAAAYAIDATATLVAIQDSMVEELSDPTSPVTGDFVRKN